MKKAKEDWIGAQCEEIETCLNKNNSKRAYQLVKDLTSEKQGRSSTINVLLKKNRFSADGQNIAQNCTTKRVVETTQYWTAASPRKILQPILCVENEIAVASLKKWKSAGIDNIPAELVQAGGETMIDVLTEICNRIWRTGERPTPCNQSLIITLPKKGNLQLYQNHRIISLISHSSKVMLKVILNRLNPKLKK